MAQNFARRRLARIATLVFAPLLLAGFLQIPIQGARSLPRAAAATPTDAYGQAVMADGPSAYYRLDETGGATAADTTANGPDAQYGPDATYSVTGALPGTTDTAVSVPQDGDQVLSSDGSGLPSGTSPRTIEFWIDSTSSGSGSIVEEGGLGLSVVSDGLQVTADGSGGGSVALPGSITNGQWHLVDVAYDGQSAFVYVDGQPMGGFSIGAITGSPGLSFGELAGSYDELAIYPSVLTATEIDQHWSIAGSDSDSCKSAPVSSYPEAVTANSPAAYYRLVVAPGETPSGPAWDDSGNCATGSHGLADQAASSGPIDGEDLDATTLSVSADPSTPTEALEAPSTNLPGGNAARTVEFWADLGAGSHAAVDVAYGDLLTLASAGGVSFGEPATPSGPVAQVTTSQLTASAWHLVDVTYNGSGVDAYVDSHLVGSQSMASLTGAAGAAPLEVLLAGGSAVEDLAIYPSALDADQIAATDAAAGAASTTTSLSAPTETIDTGTAATFTATVSQADSTPVTAGTVTFSSGTNTLGSAPLDSTGVASITAAALPAGADQVIAAFTPSGVGAPSHSAPATVFVAGSGATVTILTASPMIAVPGTPVTFTATVTDPTGDTDPAGNVTFDGAGGAPLGSATIEGGTASFQASGLAPGVLPITASYAGQGSDQASTSQPVDVNVDGAPATVALSVPASPVPPDQPETFTVSVAGSGAETAPTGTVTLSRTAQFPGVVGVLASGSLSSSGSATLVVPAGDFGLGTSTAFLASYSGDGTYDPSTTAPVSLTDTAPQDSTTALSLATSSIAPDDELSGTVTVTGSGDVDAFGPSPDGGGTLSWSVDGAPVDDDCLPGSVPPAGVVSFTDCQPAGTTFGTPGSHGLQVAYSGNDTYQPSESTTASVVVTAPTLATVVLTPSATAATYGQSTTLSAQVYTTAQQGQLAGTTVTFSEGSTTLGTAVLNSTNTAILTTANLSGGDDLVTATWDDYPAYAMASDTTTIEVAPGTASLTLDDWTVQSSAVTFTFAMTGVSGGAVPTGAVTIYADTTEQPVLGYGTINSTGWATVTVPGLGDGNQSLCIGYGGDENYAAIPTQCGSIPIGDGTANPEMSMTASNAPYGSAVTLTATFSGTTSGYLDGFYLGSIGPGGFVTFSDGSTVLGTVEISGDSATLTTSALPVGTDDIVGQYGGEPFFEPAQQSAQAIVTPAAPTVSISTSAQEVEIGQDLYVEALVAPAGSGAVPTGSVTFDDGGAALGAPVPLVTAGNQAVALIDTTALPVGSDQLTVSYAGDVNYVAATSAPTAVTVIDPTSIADITLSSTPADPSYGQTVALSAAVTDPSGAGSPTGEVYFSVTGPTGTVNGFQVAIVGGVASVTAAVLPGGTDQVAATYGGDATYFADSATPIEIEVAPEATATSLSAIPSDVAVGQAVTLVASVTTGTLVGDDGVGDFVTFEDQSDPADPIDLATVATIQAAGTLSATATVDDLAAGDDDIVAVFGGDGDLGSSASTPVSVPVSQADEPSDLVLSPGATSVVLGNSLTVSGSVQDAGSLGQTPTGNVTFSDNGNVVATAVVWNGDVWVTLSGLAAGVHVLTATYSGDAVFAPSTWGPSTVTVDLAVGSPGNQATSLGTTITQRTLSVADSNPAASFSWSETGLPNGLSIGSESGTISGTPVQAGTFDVTVTATDSFGDSGSVSFTWTVSDTITFTSPGTISGPTGTAFSRQLAATDSDGQPISFSTTSEFPPGLTLSSTGLISGTPTTAGSFNVSVTASDTAGTSAVRRFNFVETNTVSVENPGTQSATIGQTFNLAMTASDSSSVAQIEGWTAQDLPPGLSINASSGAISGTPTSPGNDLVTVGAIDSIGFSGFASVDIYIDDQVTITDPGTLYVSPDQAVDYQLAATDSYAGATISAWYVDGLPNGLSADQSTGEITGTTTAIGDYSVSVTAQDDVDGTSWGTGQLTFELDVYRYVGVASITANATSFTYGDPSPAASVTVSVSAQGNDTVVPVGPVALDEGGQQAGQGTLDANGQATISGAQLPVGQDQVSVTYQGDSLVSPATSNAVTITVLPVASALNVSVTPSTPTSNADVVATVTLSGTGTGLNGGVCPERNVVPM